MGCKYINTGTTYLLKKKKKLEKKLAAWLSHLVNFAILLKNDIPEKEPVQAVKIFKYSNPYEAVRSVNKIGISYVMYFNLHMLLEY